MNNEQEINKTEEQEQPRPRVIVDLRAMMQKAAANVKITPHVDFRKPNQHAEL